MFQRPTDKSLCSVKLTIPGRSYLNVEMAGHTKKAVDNIDRMLLADHVPATADIAVLRASLNGFFHSNDGLLVDAVGFSSQVIGLGEVIMFSGSVRPKIILTEEDDEIKIVIRSACQSVQFHPVAYRHLEEEYPFLTASMKSEGKDILWIDSFLANTYQKKDTLINLEFAFRYVARTSAMAEHDYYDLRKRIFSAALDRDIDEIEDFSAVELREKLELVSFSQLYENNFFHIPIDATSASENDLEGRLIFEATRIDMAPRLTQHALVMQQQNFSSLQNELSFLSIAQALLTTEGQEEFWKDSRNVQGLCLSLMHSLSELSLTESENAISHKKTLKMMQLDVTRFDSHRLMEVILFLKQHVEQQSFEMQEHCQKLTSYSVDSIWENVKTLLREMELDILLFLLGRASKDGVLIIFATDLKKFLEPMNSINGFFEFLQENKEQHAVALVRKIIINLMGLTSFQSPYRDFSAVSMVNEEHPFLVRINNVLGAVDDLYRNLKQLEVLHLSKRLLNGCALLFPYKHHVLSRVEMFVRACSALSVDENQQSESVLIDFLCADRTLSFHEKYQLFRELTMPQEVPSFQQLQRREMGLWTRGWESQEIETKARSFETMIINTLLPQLLQAAALDEFASKREISLKDIENYFVKMNSLCRLTNAFYELLSNMTKLFSTLITLIPVSTLDETNESQMTLLFQVEILKFYYVSQSADYLALLLQEKCGRRFFESACNEFFQVIEVADAHVRLLLETDPKDAMFASRCEEVEGHLIIEASETDDPNIIKQRNSMVAACFWMAALANRSAFSQAQVADIHAKICVALSGLGVELPGFVMTSFETSRQRAIYPSTQVLYGHNHSNGDRVGSLQYFPEI